MSRPLRILYAAGPGDVIGTYRHWQEGHDDPSQVAITYSGQFYSVCRELGAEGYVISSNPRIERIADGPFLIEHRPSPFGKSGPLYHFAQVWNGLRLTVSAMRFGADVAIVSGGAHWFSLGWMSMLGVKVVPTLHCVLWRKGRKPQGMISRIILALDARFFRKRTAAVLSLSNDITEQVNELLRGTNKPIVPFIPSYRTKSFSDLGQAKPAPPFRVFFAGRIERNKGVFDLLEIARRFAADGRTDIEFDICGDGGALPDLRHAADAANLAARFRCHGHLEKPQMRQMYSAAHVVIVPTTTDFIEGFNKVVAEAVLAGKPVITSSVCPALEYVRDAVVEVPPDNVQAYGDAILRLSGDSALYESKRQGCGKVESQFYDANRGWAAAVKRMLQRIGAIDGDRPPVAE